MAGERSALSGSLYLYCVVDTASPLEMGIVGLGGHPPLNLPYRQLGAVVGLAPGGTLEPTRENLAAHEGVVEAVMARHGVLPVRFGTAVPGEESVRRLLQSQYERLSALLRQLAGRVEFGLKVLWDPPDAPPAEDGAAAVGGPGTAFLVRRWRQQRQEAWRRDQAEPLAAAVDAHLRGHYERQRGVLLPTPRLLLSAAHLVPAPGAEDFRAAVAAAMAAQPGLRWLLTGPWPPYHFADVEGG